MKRHETGRAMKEKRSENVVIVRRTGRLGLRAMLCIPPGALVSIAVFTLADRAGWASSPLFAVAAGVAVACWLFAATLPQSTLFDLDASVVRIGGIGMTNLNVETIPFRDILDIRPVTRGDANGYCLRLRANPLFACRILGDVAQEDAYSREFRLQALPKIRKALSGADGHPPQPDADLACFERKSGGWERKSPFFPCRALLFLGLGCAFLSDRRHIVDPERRTLTICRGWFFQKPEILRLDDIESVPVELIGRKRAAAYLRFKGESKLRFLASGDPERLRNIAACYALAMNLDLSGMIEYLA